MKSLADMRLEVRAALHQLKDRVAHDIHVIHKVRMEFRAEVRARAACVLKAASDLLPGGERAMTPVAAAGEDDALAGGSGVAELTLEQANTLSQVLAVRTVQLAQQAAGLLRSSKSLASVPKDDLRPVLARLASELEGACALEATVKREFSAVQRWADLLDEKSRATHARAKDYYLGTALPRFLAARTAIAAATEAGEDRLDKNPFETSGRALVGGGGSPASGSRVEAPSPPVSESGASLPMRQGSNVALRYTAADEALERTQAAAEIAEEARELADQFRVLFGEVKSQEETVEAIAVHVEEAAQHTEKGAEDLGQGAAFVWIRRKRALLFAAASLAALLIALLVLQLRYNLLRK
jgi:hypothetical protein